MSIDQRLREPAVGDTIDRRYLLRRELGKGGMATVFEAEHLATRRRVAIKLSPRDDVARKDRLMREAAVLGAVRHPSIVDVLDAGETPDAVPFLVMELLEGRTLEGLLAARGTLPIPDVVRIGLELCAALAVAHGRDVLHRDLKPGNVFLVPDGALAAQGGPRLKLIDFGIAKVPDAEGTTKLTGPGEVHGTPEYMSPEQIRCEPLDARADLYALAVTLFECLTGTVPYPGSYGEVLRKVMRRGPVPSLRARRDDVPAALAAAIERAMSYEPSDRFPDVSTFAGILREFSGGREGNKPAPVPVEQRRTYVRAAYGTPVRLAREGQVPVDGRSEDISEGGMLVLADSSIGVGERAELRFAVPATGAIARVPGVVRWVRPGRAGKAAVGFEFAELPDGARLAIAHYVRWMATGPKGGTTSP